MEEGPLTYQEPQTRNYHREIAEERDRLIRLAEARNEVSYRMHMENERLKHDKELLLSILAREGIMDPLRSE